jgi:AcrR family transcriptional regulator
MGPESVRAGRPARVATAAMRACLCDAMTQLIYEHGYHSASLRQLARAAGLQMSSIYHYFPSKQDLLFEIMTRALGDLAESVDAAIAAAGSDPVARLCAAMAAHIAFHAERHCQAFVAVSELRSLTPANRARITAMRDKYRRVFNSLLEQGRNDGAFAVPDVPLAVTALMSMCTEVSAWYRPDGRRAVPAIIDSYTGLLLRGIMTDQAREVR